MQVPEKIFTFDPPLEFANKSYSELVLHEPNLQQVATAQKLVGNHANLSDITAFRTSLIGSVAGVSRQVIEQVPYSKFVEMAEYLQGFLPEFQTDSSL